MLSSFGEYEARLVSTQTLSSGSLTASTELMSGEFIKDEIPRKFTSELASAIGAARVLIVLDTFENLLPPASATLDPLLSLAQPSPPGRTRRRLASIRPRPARFSVWPFRSRDSLAGVWSEMGWT